MKQPKILKNTSQPAPTPSPAEDQEWNPPPPPPPPAEESFHVSLTHSEIKFIIQAMVHSANIHKCFCEQGSDMYPLKETNAYIREVNRLRKILEAA